jgi:hemolysin III
MPTEGAAAGRAELIGPEPPRAASREIAVDHWVHIGGTLLGAIGAASLLATVASGADNGRLVPIVIYTFGLMAMLCCSALYNLAAEDKRAFLRRLDHAAIFLMIAGTYTPFTTRFGDDMWSLSVTVFVWAVALAGAAAKLLAPHYFERLSILVYLALGWTALAAFGRIQATLDSTTIDLLVAGGATYSLGVVFYLWRGLRFHNAIWHLLVLVAAACHYAAVLRIAA